MKKQEVNNKALGDALMGVKEELDSFREEFNSFREEFNSLNASLDEANRWASLAQEAAEIEAVRARLAANAPRKRFILKESTGVMYDPRSFAPKKIVKFEGPIF